MNLLDSVINEPSVPQEVKDFFRTVIQAPSDKMPMGLLVQSVAFLTCIQFASDGMGYDDVPDRMGVLMKELNKRFPVE